MKKNGLFLMIALLAVCISVVSATGSKEAAGTPAGAAQVKAGGKLWFDNPVTLTLMTASAPNWPIQEDWYVYKMIKKHTNADIKVIAIPNANYGEKLRLTMVSGDLPDMINTVSATANQYGEEGAFKNLLEYRKSAPHFDQWVEKNKNAVMNFVSSSGKLFLFPANEIGETNRQGWLYRKDVFDKHSLALPKNDREMYDLLKKLKTLYPDSFPLAFRNGLTQLGLIAPSWGAQYGYFNDAPAGGWKYGPVEDGFKNLVVFLNQLYKEALIPLDFLSVNTKAWTDMMSTDKAFLTIDFLVRIDFFNQALRKDKPSYTLAYMPPWKGGDKGIAKMTFTAFSDGGNVISAKTPRVQDAMKFTDWMYTDEGTDLLSWGEEGVAYKTVNGKRTYFDMIDLYDIMKKTGLATMGMYTRFDYNSRLAILTPELAAAVVESRKDDMDMNIPVTFTAEEQETVSIKGQAIAKHRDEEIAKFILGKRSLSEWDQYKQEMKKLGLDDMVALYAKSYQRAMSLMK